LEQSFGFPNFLEMPKFPYNTDWVGQVEGSLRAKYQLDSSSRFDTIPACDGRTDGQSDKRTHNDSTYRASIASRGKTAKFHYTDPTGPDPT